MILAEIHIPALNRQYEFKLDEYRSIADIVEEIGEMVAPPERNGAPGCVQELLLCSYELGRILPLDHTLEQEGLGNGCRLVLI